VIETVLVRFKYYQLKRAEKGVIRRYIEKVSGYSRAQVSRLIREYNQRGQLRKAQYRRHRFPRSYTTADIALLVRTDELPDWARPITTRKCPKANGNVSTAVGLGGGGRAPLLKLESGKATIPPSLSSSWSGYRPPPTQGALTRGASPSRGLVVVA